MVCLFIYERKFRIRVSLAKSPPGLKTFSTSRAPGIGTFNLHLSGQSCLCLVFIFIFAYWKAVSPRECFKLMQAHPDTPSILHSFSWPTSHGGVWLWGQCAWAYACMCTHAQTHTRTYLSSLHFSFLI